MKLLMHVINFSRLRIFQIILAIQICTVITTQAQQFSFSGLRHKDAIRFMMVKNLIIIPLYINDQGPFNFILDTGVGPLIITAPSLMDSLGLKVSRPIKIAGLGEGNEIDAFVSNDISARVGKSEIKNIPAVILKEDIFGLSNYLGTKVYGLLGYYFFKSFIVQIKYSGKRIIFSLPGSGRKIKGLRVPLEINSDKPYINLAIETPELGLINLKMLVDNGASHAISLERLNETPFPVPSSTIVANLGIGMGGHINGNIGRVSSLKIGNYVLKDVLAAYPKYEDAAAKILLKGRNGNLGADVLSRFNIIFDYSASSMYLKPNNQFNRPFEHDMSGIELYVLEDKKARHYFISRIEPGSPAENAGLMIDDEILFINLSPASVYKLNDLTNLFKSASGKTFNLSILRAGELFIKQITLKQRI